MDTFQRLTAAAVLSLAGTAAHAGYAQASPPPGFQPMPSAGPVTNWGYARSANEALVNGTVRTNAALNVGGRTITMPAAMRFASNAPRFAAAVLFSNPYLRAGMAAAAWLGAAKVIWDESSKTWKTEVLEEISPYKYKIYGSETVYESAQEACNTFFANNQYRTTVTPIQKQANGSYFGCSIAYQVEGITYWYPIQNINPFLACPTSLQNGKCLIANTSPLTKETLQNPAYRVLRVSCPEHNPFS